MATNENIGHIRSDKSAVPLKGRRRMHPEDVMNPDVLSEILLLISASLILATLLLILTAALTKTAALR